MVVVTSLRFLFAPHRVQFLAPGIEADSVISLHFFPHKFSDLQVRNFYVSAEFALSSSTLPHILIPFSARRLLPVLGGFGGFFSS